MKMIIMSIAIGFFSNNVWAQHSMHDMNSMQKKEPPAEAMKMSSHTTMGLSPKDCDDMQVFDKTSHSCVALPMASMPMSMWMIHGNGFLVQNAEEGPRGRSRFSAPNMLMAELGKSHGNHYFNTNLMLTAEKWTFPQGGYPELLQIGEVDENEKPFIDAQHPHSSPIMGLTFSDTIKLADGKDFVRIFIAPRGQATDGPVAFMHRPTGMVNPDAPLGHHIGQDVSHITSSVVGVTLSKGPAQFEVSAFNGTEPEPTKSDLPLGTLNSFAARIAYSISDDFFAMISASQANDPEPHDPTLKRVNRYSASAYSTHEMPDGKMVHGTFILGLVNDYDHVALLRSVLHEVWFSEKDRPHNYWGRVEFVERTATELAITGTARPNDPKWVTALTAGYTYKMKLNDSLESGLGASITKDFLPQEFCDSYGGEPLSGKIFLQISGMKMGSY